MLRHGFTSGLAEAVPVPSGGQGYPQADSGDFTFLPADSGDFTFCCCGRLTANRSACFEASRQMQRRGNTMRRHECVQITRTTVLNLMRELGESDVTRRLFLDACAEAWEAARTLHAWETEIEAEVEPKRLAS
jgi:hypothetical protein